MQPGSDIHGLESAGGKHSGQSASRAAEDLIGVAVDVAFIRHLFKFNKDILADHQLLGSSHCPTKQLEASSCFAKLAETNLIVRLVVCFRAFRMRARPSNHCGPQCIFLR